MRHVGETGVKPVLRRNCNHETTIESWKPEHPLDDRSGTFERKGRSMKNLHDLSPLSCNKGVLFSCLLDRGSQANVTSQAARMRYLVRAVFSCLVLAILTMTGTLTPSAAALGGECHVHGAAQLAHCAALTSNTWPARMAAAAPHSTGCIPSSSPMAVLARGRPMLSTSLAAPAKSPDGPAWQPGSASALDALRHQVPAYLTDAGRTAKFLTGPAAGEDVRHVNGVDLIAFVCPLQPINRPLSLWPSLLPHAGCAGSAHGRPTGNRAGRDRHPQPSASHRRLGVAHRRPPG